MQSLSLARSHGFLLRGRFLPSSALRARPPARKTAAPRTDQDRPRTCGLSCSFARLFAPRRGRFFHSSALRARPPSRKTAALRTLGPRAAKQHLLRRCMQLVGMQKLGIYASILVFYILQNITAYHCLWRKPQSEASTSAAASAAAARANSPTAAAARRSSRLTRTALWNRYKDTYTRN
jgi:hypothetical protein